MFNFGINSVVGKPIIDKSCSIGLLVVYGLGYCLCFLGLLIKCLILVSTV